MSESNDVVVGVVEYDAAPSLAKPARGPVVVELVVDGSPSRRFADRSSHIPTPSTYDEFARPRFFADAVVVPVVVSVVVPIIIVSPISHPLARSRSLDRARRASSSHARRSPRARLPLSSRVVVRRSAVFHRAIHPVRFAHAFKPSTDRPTHRSIDPSTDRPTDRPIDPSTDRLTDRAGRARWVRLDPADDGCRDVIDRS